MSTQKCISDQNMYFVDSLHIFKSYFELIFPSCCNSSKSVLYSIFDIRTPFLMDGEAKKLSTQFIEDAGKSFNGHSKRLYSEHFAHKKAKKRKKRHNLSSIESTKADSVQKKFLQMQDTEKFKEFFNFFPSVHDIFSNNILSRKARDWFMSKSDVTLPDLDSSNEDSVPVIRWYCEHDYLIPPKCRYIVGDVRELAAFLEGDSFDVVIMDPPFHNKHIQRKRTAKGVSHSYWTMSVEEIFQIPLTKALSERAFVFIWITNSEKIYREFMSGLASWDLELVTEWFWLKVTKSGEPVSDLEASSNGKLPFERLLVTRRIHHGGKPINFPDSLMGFTFCSVPSSVHSHKPPLKDLLNKCLAVDETWNCLELFARFLTPNWTCFGKEVLRFQDLLLCKELPPVVEEDKDLES